MFRLHLFIKKQARTARKGSVGLNNNVAQFGAVDKVSQQPSRYVIMRKTT